MFSYKITKKWEWKYLRFAAFEAITFEPIKIQTHLASQNDRLSLSFVKNEDTHSKKNGQKRSYNSYLRVTFISDHSLGSKYDDMTDKL